MELDRLKANVSLQEVQTAKDCAPTKRGFVRPYAVELVLTGQSSKQIVLVLDNASWHKSASINWHHIKPKYLPPYSPDFNPIEIVWLCLKRDFFTSWFAKTADERATPAGVWRARAAMETRTGERFLFLWNEPFLLFVPLSATQPPLLLLRITEQRP